MNGRTALFTLAVLAPLGLIAVSTWASLQVGIGTSIADLLANPSAGNNPWLVATLFDAYFGFLWFYAWVLLRETQWLPRLLWLVLILGLGNIAMGAYALLALRQLPKGAPLRALFQPRAASGAAA